MCELGKAVDQVEQMIHRRLEKSVIRDVVSLFRGNATKEVEDCKQIDIEMSSVRRDRACEHNWRQTLDALRHPDLEEHIDISTVKMSSPNLNILTLLGSVLTYASGFLFSVDELWPGAASTSVLQARTWALCVGNTLVFGPILGKTWRLYRIISDIQLLVLVDMLVLTAWGLADPVRCSCSVRAVVKVMEKDMSYSLTHLDSCSSVYSDLWVILIAAWPNLVYCTVAGAIFLWTLATNCLLFAPSDKSGEERAPVPSGKNAVIDSLQEQVNNAKDKLLWLMTSSEPRPVDRDLDSSTQTPVVVAPSSTDLPTLLPRRDLAGPAASLPPLPRTCPPLLLLPLLWVHLSPGRLARHPLTPCPLLPPWRERACYRGPPLRRQRLQGTPAGLRQPCVPTAGSVTTTGGEEEAVLFASPSDRVTSPQILEGSDHFQTGVEGYQGNRATSQLVSPGPGIRHRVFVSSEQLQEILQELSVEAALETALSGRSSLLSPLSLPTPWSPHRPALFSFPSISPYAMRKRRPPFNSSRGGQSPCFFPGPELSSGPSSGKRQGVPSARRATRERDKPICTSPSRSDYVSTARSPSSHLDNGDIKEIEEEEEEEAKQRRSGERRGGKKRVPTCHRSCTHSTAVTRCTVAPSDVEPASGEACWQSKRATRDSYGSWDSDSSSSADYCYYHRPYCDSCLQRGSLLSLDTSDGEYGSYIGLYRSPHP
ncbi:hypothetical protein CRUP_028614, partial [Coryphaenoides rupestris]